MTRSAALRGVSLFLMLAPASAALAQKPPAGPSHEAGRQAYEAACLSCHYNGARKTDFSQRSPAGKSTPDEMIRKILFGVPAEDDEPGLRMPGYAAGLTDAEIAGIAAYLRAARTTSAPWSDLEKRVTTLRARGPRDD
jgi:mono/diheme cytochrome c family protein